MFKTILHTALAITWIAFVIVAGLIINLAPIWIGIITFRALFG